MKVRMTDLWKPVRGVTIKETKVGQFLFHFAHPLDMEAVLNGGPWSFDNNMLILEQVKLGMQIEQIPLQHVNMWVQVHDLPTGLMKEKYGISLANYIGSFVEYDKNNNSSFWRQYMRLRVRIDVRLPLKKETKVKDKEGRWCTVKFKYEKLGIFCFVCGVMGNAENKCEVRFSMEQDDGVRGWSSEIRAENRRQGGRLTSRWLREDGGGQSEIRGGEGSRQPQTPVSSTQAGPTNADVASNLSLVVHDRSDPNQPDFIARQEQSLPINTKAHPSSHLTNNHISNNNPIVTTPIQNMPAIFSTNVPVPPFMTNNDHNSITHDLPISVSIPNIHSTLTNHQQQLIPITPSRPQTDNNKSPSLLNYSLTFNSQPLHRAPLPVKKSTKASRASGPKGMVIRPVSITNTDPSLQRNRPEKKQKIPTLIPNPTHTTLDPSLTHECSEDMEALIEKKRRREEEVEDNTGKLKEVEHFLTAGPGSQACRDQ
jgi:hypothetical protein